MQRMVDGLTTSQRASLAIHGEVKRGKRHLEPKAPLTGGADAPDARPGFFTSLRHRAWRAFSACALVWTCTTGLSSGAGIAPDDWWVALANDRVGEIRQWLAYGTSPNVATDKGMPALMQAVRVGAWNSFDVLLEHSELNVHVTNAVNESPLMYLAIVGDTARAQRLIAKGAAVNRLGWTPLHYAASRGRTQTLQLLLAHQAIVNAPAPDGTSPLMMAAYSGSAQAVQILLDAGADATMRNLPGRSVVDWAHSAGHTLLAQKLDALLECVLKHRRALRKQGIDAAPVALNAQCWRPD